jgi:pimeloyl-ACP methyl ester carboxylesterase
LTTADLRSGFVILFSLLMLGCSSAVEKNHLLALEQGFEHLVIRGAPFSHAVYVKPGKPETQWHIYIEGDGSPWLARYLPAPNPNSENPLMLRLMAKDTAPAIYLGRPCYQGQTSTPPCSTWDWTHGRYSERVVSSLQSVLNTLIKDYSINSLMLIGHSGGGTLAMLLADRIPQTRSLVTLAGNLDIEAWTQAHGYSPLSGSLNPADAAPLANSIDQFHFIGAGDRNTGKQTVAWIKDKYPEARIEEIEGVAHVSGWESHFCRLLAQAGGNCDQ